MKFPKILKITESKPWCGRLDPNIGLNYWYLCRPKIYNKGSNPFLCTAAISNLFEGGSSYAHLIDIILVKEEVGPLHFDSPLNPIEDL